MTFAEFLALARRETYAIPHGDKLGDGTEHMAFDLGSWRYRDRYTGRNPYGGQELVWFEGRPVWMEELSGRGRLAGMLLRGDLSLSAACPWKSGPATPDARPLVVPRRPIPLREPDRR